MFDTLIANLAAAPWADTAMALGQVLMIDLVLAGDNAVAVGLAAAGLAAEQRRKAILAGLAAAVAGAAVRRLRSAVPSAPVFQVASPSPHFSFSGSSDAVYSTGEVLSALAWDSGRRKGGGSGSQHAGPGWGGGLLFFASESAAAGFGHRVAWSRRGVAARA